MQITFQIMLTFKPKTLTLTNKSQSTMTSFFVNEVGKEKKWPVVWHCDKTGNNKDVGIKIEVNRRMGRP
jgi:hypothetical protein